MIYRCVEEAPAGLAGFSLWVHGGKFCKPPLSRQGNKAGYSHALGVLAGIRAGEGAGCYVWSEADADVRGLLRAYPDAGMLLRIAEIIRGWKDEEPRALWERLRAERKARPSATDEEGVAGWIWSTAVGHPGGGGFTGEFRALAPAAQAHMGPTTCAKYARENGVDARGYPLAPQGCSRGEVAKSCEHLAAYAQIAASNRLINVAGPDLSNTGAGGTTFGGEAFATPPETVARGFERVAGWIVESTWSIGSLAGSGGFSATSAYGNEIRSSDGRTDFMRPQTPNKLASRVVASGSSGWPPVLVLATIPEAADLAAWLGTPGDLEGVLCYSDPPYQRTTGYFADLPRAEVVRHAIARAEMGARVMVSEAVPLEELTALGWYATRIDHARKGQRRTFSKQQAEWVTTSFEPVDRIRNHEQVGLFAGGAA